MIERLQIENYQKHELFRVRFDPHCTTFTGRTEAGKTAILRALFWLVTNRPLGTEDIRWGADTATVRLGVDGRTVTRRRGPHVNHYRLDGCPKPYKALGREVPEAVRRVLNLSDVNFQWQHDAPFWFADSAGQVSRKLNAIVNLDIIDTTLTNLTNAQRRATVVVELAEERFVEANKEATRLAHVPELAGDWEWVERLGQRAALARATHATLAVAVAGALAHAHTAQGAARAATAGRATVALGVAARKARTHAETLAATTTTANVATATAARPVPVLGPLEAAAAAAKKARRYANDIDYHLANIRATQFDCDRLGRLLSTARLELDKYLKEGKCPTCGKPLTT